MEYSGETDTPNKADPEASNNEKVSPFQATLEKLVPGFQRTTKIKTASQLVDLIENTYNFDKQTEKQIYDQITHIEIIEFIFYPGHEFLFTVATRLSYKCLVFLKKMGFGEGESASMLDGKSKITKEFVRKLNQSKLETKKKEEILSILLYFNQKGAKTVVAELGNKEIKRILKKLVQKAETKKAKKIEEFSDESSGSDLSEEAERIDRYLQAEKERRKMKGIWKPSPFESLEEI